MGPIMVDVTKSVCVLLQTLKCELLSLLLF